MKKRQTPEQIVRKLREADAELPAGASVPEIARRLGISEVTFHRWRNQYGRLIDETRRAEEREIITPLGQRAWYACTAPEKWLTARTSSSAFAGAGVDGFSIAAVLLCMKPCRVPLSVPCTILKQTMAPSRLALGTTVLLPL